jgi:ATP synthase protein I
MHAAPYRVVSAQATIAVLAALLTYAAFGAPAAKAVWYGAAVALVNGLLLVWRMRQSALQPSLDAQRHLRKFYRSSLERFFLVSLLLAGGLGLLNLLPLAVISGFVLGQVTLIVAEFMRGIEN